MNNAQNNTEIGIKTREHAHSILFEITSKKRTFDDVLKSHKGFKNLNTRDRAFAYNLVATTLRRLGQIDAIINERLERGLPRSADAARNALRLGLCQILFLDIQTHAAVNTSVEIAGRRGPQKFKAVVNGILRRVTREGAETIAKCHPEEQNVPDWMRRSWKKTFGIEMSQKITKTNLSNPPIDLTVTDDPDQWASKLDGIRIGKVTVRLAGSVQIESVEGFKEGKWWVQDAAAALSAQILTTRAPGERVCDLCAAPGGKTIQLLSAGLNVTAVDKSEDRLHLLQSNLTRLKLNAHVIKKNILNWDPPKLFDAVLLDAPCCATGTIRRHPDIPHLKSSKDVPKLVKLQEKLIDCAIKFMVPGGILVYSVCSLEAEEGIDQVSKVLSRNSSIEIDPIRVNEIQDFEKCLTEMGCVQTTPAHLSEIGGVDGFFIARFRKKI